MKIIKPLLEGKFWVIQDDSEKRIGTISFNESLYQVNTENDIRISVDKSQIKQILGEDVDWLSTNPTSLNQKSVYGYPTTVTPHNPIYDVRRGFPLFSKSEQSKSLFCAGYYLIRFNKGWCKAFCPKLITLERYEHKGPYRTEAEAITELTNARNSYSY